ncbi:MAG: hypothetical protein AB7S38_15900 [Vulcanimicrobiota bacterium]
MRIGANPAGVTPGGVASLRSFERRFPIAPKDGFSPSAEFDRSIRRGQPIFMGELDMAHHSRQTYRSQLLWESVGKGVFGGAAGLALSNLSPWGAVAGAMVGVYVAWSQNARTRQGTVDLEVDGVKSKTRWYLKPDHFEVPNEVRQLKALADGYAGDRISAHTGQAASPDPARLAAWKPHRSVLASLGQARRLVADFGQKSHYGYAALNLVEAPLAEQMLAAGQKVYVVNGAEPEDQVHHYRVESRNAMRSVLRLEDRQVIERTFAYKLTPLADPEQLAGVAGAHGLPEGMVGVYSELESLTQTVVRDNQQGQAIVGENFRDIRHQNSSFSRDLSLPRREPVAQVHTVRGLDWRGISMMGGALAGILTGMSVLPGVPTAALAGVVAGGIAGREFGHWLNFRK